MWRVGVLIVLSVLFASDAAQYQYGTQLRRIRRSPHYDCPPFYPPPPPRFWPPPPPRHHNPFGPPPFWPPPPPFPQEEPNQPQQIGSSQSQAQSSAKSEALMQQPGGQGQGHQDREQGHQDRGQGHQDKGPIQDRGQGQLEGDSQYLSNQPCDTCGGRGQQNSAVSNAKSDSGSAIAIAISGKNSSG